MKIGIQGSEGSYHEQVARDYFGDTADIEYIDTFSHVFDALQLEKVTHAVIAIANNRYNVVPEAYNKLIERHSEVTITGEAYLRVQHQLLGVPGTTLATIKEVHSQAPALGQCMKFLAEQLPHIPHVEREDTAESAAFIAREADVSKAAIASARAGALHGLEVIAPNIQDDADNMTRFLVLQRQGEVVADTTKTSLLLRVGQHAGALVDALIPFKEQGVNISTLQAAYLPNTDFEVQFFMEFDAGRDDMRTAAVLQTLKSHDTSFEILGSYMASSHRKDTL